LVESIINLPFTNIYNNNIGIKILNFQFFNNI
jgi:hypothetical protein